MSLVIALVALLASAAAGQSNGNYYDVCVIGAGPSGVSAIKTLHSRTNKSVAVFDVQTGVGGQALPSYTDERGAKVHSASRDFSLSRRGSPRHTLDTQPSAPVGAIWILPHDYNLTLKYAQELGLGLMPVEALLKGSNRRVVTPKSNCAGPRVPFRPALSFPRATESSWRPGWHPPPSPLPNSHLSSTWSTIQRSATSMPSWRPTAHACWPRRGCRSSATRCELRQNFLFR